MKRISLLVAIVALAPAVSHAGCYSSQRYRVHYSPYAFNYHSSGLVRGGLKYSPYAYDLHTSGLVLDGARYTPYAYNYHSSGLVVDYTYWPTTACPVVQVVETCASPSRGTAVRPRSCRTVSRGRYVSREKLQETRAADGEHIVRQYLQSQGLDEVRIDRRLCIENQTAGAAFILHDKNLVIRYSNPEIMASLEEAGGGRARAAERYEENWESFARDVEARGGTVYCVDAAEPDQIVAALAACEALNGDNPAQPVTMVAKE